MQPFNKPRELKDLRSETEIIQIDNNVSCIAKVSERILREDVGIKINEDDIYLVTELNIHIKVKHPDGWDSDKLSDEEIENFLVAEASKHLNINTARLFRRMAEEYKLSRGE